MRITVLALVQKYGVTAVVPDSGRGTDLGVELCDRDDVSPVRRLERGVMSQDIGDSSVSGHR